MLYLTLSILPFLYVQIYVGDFLRDVFANYQFAGHAQTNIFPIHLKNPEIFLQTLSELMTFLSLEHNWRLLLIPTIIFIFIPVYPVLRMHRNNRIFKLASWTYLTLVFTFLSPVASYIQGHLTGFLILYIAVLVIVIDKSDIIFRRFSQLTVFALVIFSLYWMPNIEKNQYQDISWFPEYIRNEGISPVPISDGAYLVLQHTPYLNGADFPVYICNSTNHIEEFLAQFPPEKRRLVIATFDCDVFGAINNLGQTIRRERRITTLHESHLANGIVFYFIENQRGGRKR